MKHRLLLLLLGLSISAGVAQDDTVVIHIKLINGRTGNPMKNKEVSFQYRHSFALMSARTDEFGIAAVNVRRSAVILTENTDSYVDCADEKGGLVRNDYRVVDILSTGVVDQIVPPNRCGKTSATAKPGELILFVRPWRFGEKI